MTQWQEHHGSVTLRIIIAGIERQLQIGQEVEIIISLHIANAAFDRARSLVRFNRATG